ADARVRQTVRRRNGGRRRESGGHPGGCGVRATRARGLPGARARCNLHAPPSPPYPFPRLPERIMPKSKPLASMFGSRLSALLTVLLLAAFLLPASADAQSRRVRQLLDEVTADVEANRKLTQVMVDKIFSFS